MKLPRQVSGAEVIKALEKLGFEKKRQVGSHVQLANEDLRVTVPAHDTLAPGTLKSILRQAHVDLSKLLEKL